jgi:hypothetical protein
VHPRRDVSRSYHTVARLGNLNIIYNYIYIYSLDCLNLFEFSKTAGGRQGGVGGNRPVAILCVYIIDIDIDIYRYIYI